MGKQRLNKGRVIMTFALAVGTIVAADSLRRNFFVTPDTTIVVTGDFKGSGNSAQNNGSSVSAMSSSQQFQQSTQGISYLGYSELAVPASSLSTGLLTLVNQTHPASDNSESFVDLLEEKNEFYSLFTEDIVLNADAADALNRMMQDYNAATGLSDFVVYSTTQPHLGEDSLCPASFPESATGYTVDLAIQGAQKLLEYDGKDEEAWILENCAKYGFILRYPADKASLTGQAYCTWHLRYVGEVHAAIMTENHLCLEEYLDWIKTYTIDTAPLQYQLDGVQYEIYYTASMGDSTSVRIPVSGNYTISGNNSDGYVLTAVK